MLTTEQKELRKTGIGSSDIAAVCGLSPWRTPLDVWLEKTGRAPDREDTPQTKLGNRLERIIAEAYADERGLDLTPCKTTVGREPWIIATPDFRVGIGDDERLLEIKNVGFRVAHHWPEGEMPDYVLTQALWQMEATGLHRADVVALVGGRDLRVVPVAYDSGVLADIVDIAGTFWRSHVLADTPPKVDGSSAWAEYMKLRWPADMTPPIHATTQAEELVGRLVIARAAQEVAKEDRDECENQLKALIGDAAGMRGDGWSISWKRNSSSGTDWKGLAEFLGATPENIAKFAREGSRVFRFTKTKGS